MMTKWEQRQQFETFMRLKELSEPNRVIPADGWTPDVSVLDKPEPTYHDTIMSRATADFQAQADAWYEGA